MTSFVPLFKGEHDNDGVYVYQAYNDTLADYALAHQHFGGKLYNPTRMTWIKPSFAWVLYRSGYGKKHNQNRVLKIKISHTTLASILRQCKCKEGGSGSVGRVQWDPARDILSAEDKTDEPRKMLRERAIQIGVSKKLSEFYNANIISIEDVTELAHKVHQIHQLLKNKKIKQQKKDDVLITLKSIIPNEDVYMPHCSFDELKELGMIEGDTSHMISGIGRGNNKF